MSKSDDIENRIFDDDDSDFRKITLDEKHIPKGVGWRECNKCGRRLVRGMLALRMKNRRYLYWCGSPKLHIENSDEYRKHMEEFYITELQIKAPSNMDILVVNWEVKQKRKKILMQNYKEWDTLVDKNGNILVDKDDPEYESLKKRTQEFVAQKIKKEIESEREELLKALGLLEQKENMINKENRKDSD